MENEVGLLVNRRGTVIVSSRTVAEKFNKKPNDVHRKIEDLISTELSMPEDVRKISHMFREGYEFDSYNREVKCYYMNRDGFSLLVMGFTGSTALEWKLKYIEAFNQMEATLKQGVQLSDEQKAQLMLFSDNLEERAKGSQILQQIAVEKATKPLVQTIEQKDLLIDSVIEAKGLYSVRNVGRVLGSYCSLLGANKIFNFLRDNKIFMNDKNTTNHNMPYATYKNHFNSKYVPSTDGTKMKTYFTGSGLKWFLDKLVKENLLDKKQREEVEQQFN